MTQSVLLSKLMKKVEVPCSSMPLFHRTAGELGVSPGEGGVQRIRMKMDAMRVVLGNVRFFGGVFVVKVWWI
jgi:hypothetical protein